ncbi:hypothetical protein ABGB16_23845 [Micromonospora sp. B11E3]|uniref:hypothetical protein n=1 Tax=Micromonospora sp. B11E3 TaxID=3153562 RepID=UPI00325E72B7
MTTTVGVTDGGQLGLDPGVLVRWHRLAGELAAEPLGALAMTTPGDTSMASRREVEALVRGTGARVQR